MIAPIVVFAVGNRSRGDDAVAPLLLERLRECCLLYTSPSPRD